MKLIQTILAVSLTLSITLALLTSCEKKTPPPELVPKPFEKIDTHSFTQLRIQNLKSPWSVTLKRDVVTPKWIIEQASLPLTQDKLAYSELIEEISQSLTQLTFEKNLQQAKDDYEFDIEFQSPLKSIHILLGSRLPEGRVASYDNQTYQVRGAFLGFIEHLQSPESLQNRILILAKSDQIKKATLRLKNKPVQTVSTEKREALLHLRIKSFIAPSQQKLKPSAVLELTPFQGSKEIILFYEIQSRWFATSSLRPGTEFELFEGTRRILF